jgi:hypothetical protein
MRPYHIRQLIVVASISATITILALKVFGYLQLTTQGSSSETEFTTISPSTTQPASLPAGQSAISIKCLNGYALLPSPDNASQIRILADQYGQPIRCKP